jgi:hypothetical protein
MRRPSSGVLRTVVTGVIGAAVMAAALSLADRPADGQAAYAPPRTPDGKPDLSGIWQVLNAADVNIQDHSASSDGPAGQAVVVGNELPYKPEALKKKQENYEKRMTEDPVRNCFLPGVPRITYVPFPFQILQAPGHVAFMYEYVHTTRLIYTDGSKHRPDVEFYMGDSRGHWEGDTLVVDVTDFNNETWFDRVGNYHSDELHVVERYKRLGPDHMQYEATIEDPKVFTKPWKMQMLLYRRKEANAQILDYQCYAFDHDKKGLSVPLARMTGPKQ